MKKNINIIIIASLLLIVAYYGYSFYMKPNSEPDHKQRIRHSPTPTPTVYVKENTSNVFKNSAEPQRLLTFKNTSQDIWWKDAAVYQIWVRSFYDSDNDGNGDLAGITEKLDYIKSLGVNAIWLSPIFTSPSYHGYDTTDFYSIEPDYGTQADFDLLIARAKEMDIKVILDIALNHVSEEHPWFLKSLEKNSEFDEYFVWRDTLPENNGKAWGDTVDPTAVWHTKEARKGYYYGAFGWSQPDLNFENPKVVEEIKNVASHWLNKGIDGFRLDAIRYLIEEDGLAGQADSPKTLAFWQDFSDHVKSINPEAVLIGEALTDTPKIAEYYQQGKGIHQAFDFGFNYTVKSFLGTKEWENLSQRIPNSVALENRIRDSLWQRLARFHEQDTVPAQFFASFLNNHDSDRLTTFFEGDSTRAKISAALLAFTPGPIYFYYGEEIGMDQAATGDDMFRRGLMQWDESANAGFSQSDSLWLNQASAFPWVENFTPWWSDYWESSEANGQNTVAAQESDNASLLNQYRAFIQLRQSDETLRSPDSLGLYENTNAAWVVQFIKDDQQRLLMINLSPDNKTVFDTPQGMEGDYLDVLSSKRVTLDSSVILLPGEIRVLTVD